MKSINFSPTMGFAIGLMAILVMMVLPVPPLLLDLGLTLSFAFAVLIFSVTLFVERPLEFSSFPAILLISLLLRLALNISSTKLIIGEGHTGTGAAGGVIEGFAMFIMGGNLGLGLVIFSVLIIVNFLVITKGAGRMAEVGARFALDAMPGKQLAIDADVAAGALSHEEARELRAKEQEETAFLGSLDGASKFVKGDAVAGLLITALNLVAGIAIGLLVHGISFAEAVENYSILTVGDGLVSQIPAVIISVAAALLLSKGRGPGAVDMALARELGARPEVLVTVSVVLIVFGLFPGLPFLPFGSASAGVLFLAWRIGKKAPSDTLDPVAATEDEGPQPTNFGDLLNVDDIHVRLSPNLVRSLIEGDGSFDSRVEKIRHFIIQEYGFVMPPVRVTDDPGLATGVYEISVHGVSVSSNEVHPGKFLALIADDELPEIPGIIVKEPVYGAAARWVDKGVKDRLTADGITVVDSVEVLSTHLLEIVQQEFSKLMTRRSMRSILDSFSKPSNLERAESNRRLLDELVPERIPHDLLLQVLRSLLSERISIRNLPLILEAIAERKTPDTSVEVVIEYVRQRLAFQFVQKLQNKEGILPVIKLEDRWYLELSEAQQNSSNIELDPAQINNLVSEIKSVFDSASVKDVVPVLVVKSSIRRYIKSIVSSHKLAHTVLSFDEVAGNTIPRIIGTV